MKKEFIPYEQAIALKELGFDEPCFATYEFRKLFIGEFQNSLSFDLCKKTEVFPAPTFSQAFRWFREKYNIDAWVQPFTAEKNNGELYLPDESYSYFIFKDGVFIADKVDLFEPEEADLECLIKLIEIAKTNIK